MLNAVPPGYLPDFSSKTSPSVLEQVDPLTEDPEYSTSGTAGPLAQCLDGTYSYAVSYQGACSHHEGGAMFYR